MSRIEHPHTSIQLYSTHVWLVSLMSASLCGTLLSRWTRLVHDLWQANCAKAYFLIYHTIANLEHVHLLCPIVCTDRTFESRKRIPRYTRTQTGIASAFVYLTLLVVSLLASSRLGISPTRSDLSGLSRRCELEWQFADVLGLYRRLEEAGWPSRQFKHWMSFSCSRSGGEPFQRPMRVEFIQSQRCVGVGTLLERVLAR